MIALPIPLIVSLLIVTLLARALYAEPRWRVVHSLLALCALQSLLIALVHHYGLTGMRRVLPFTACVLPPLTWIAFRATLFERAGWRSVALHAGVPVAAGGLVLFYSPWLDAFVPLVFFAYGAAIFVTLRWGDLPLARLDAGPVPARAWTALAVALVMSALGDVIIAWGFATGRTEVHGIVVSLISSLSLLLIALMAFDRSGTAPEDSPADQGDVALAGVERDDAHASADRDLVARLDDLLRNETLFLEPDLTLARLARRLQVPAKTLSAAINRQTGENVSRHVNGFRIRHACALLDAGMTVTETIYASGFNTKSNFNREFLRVTGGAPSQWRAE